MCDIREGTTVDNNGVVLSCLHEVGVDSILQQGYYCACHAKVVDSEWGVIIAHTKHDATDTSVEVIDVARKAEDRHNLRCGSDVEACLCGNAICRATKTRYDVTQRAVVHVEHAAPHNLLQTRLLRAVVVEVVIQERSDKVICRCDGVEVASEVEVDILRGQYLRIATTCCTTLHAEAGAQRWLTQRDDSLLADVVKTHTKADAHGSLTHTRLCCGDSGYKDKVTLSYLLVVDKAVRNLCDVLTVVEYLIIGEAYLCGYLTNILKLGLTSDLNICFHIFQFLLLLFCRKDI